MLPGPVGGGDGHGKLSTYCGFPAAGGGEMARERHQRTNGTVATIQTLAQVGRPAELPGLDEHALSRERAIGLSQDDGRAPLHFA
jgi:hypothetical protein